jgi:hypothetical protein
MIRILMIGHIQSRNEKKNYPQEACPHNRDFLPVGLA